MKINRLILAIIASLPLLSACATVDRPRDTVFQVSTIDALMAGIYDGDTTLRELSRHGDFGVGTFAALDGEMVLLDGTFYQIGTDGTAHTISPETVTPFCGVTFFEPDRSFSLAETVDYPGLKEYVGGRLPTENIFYAVRVDGTFDEITIRSVPRQHKPYPPLADVAKGLPDYTFHNVTGTLVGFVCPAYFTGVSIPGWHLHLITDDRRLGGHVVSFSATGLTVGVDDTPSVSVHLLTNAEFYGADFTGDTGDAIKRVEK
jgi:acetolactate decarboxylase